MVFIAKQNKLQSGEIPPPAILVTQSGGLLEGYETSKYYTDLGSNEDGRPAAILLLVLCLFGIACNVAGIVGVRKLESTFGRTCIAFAACNFLCLFIGMIYYAPLIFWKDITSLNISLRKQVSHVMQFSWYANLYCHLATSTNRLKTIVAANFSPHFTPYDPRQACALIAFLFFLAFIQTLPFFWEETCYVIFNPMMWGHEVSPNWCGKLMTTYLDFYFCIGVAVTMAALNAITLFYLKKWHKKMKNLLSTDEKEARRNMETKLFFQSFLQNLAEFSCNICNYVVARFAVTQWENFLTEIVSWMAYHAVDGLLLVVFQFDNLRCTKKDSPSQQKGTLPRSSVSNNQVDFHSSGKESHLTNFPVRRNRIDSLDVKS